jgi:hypothetical protein
MTRRCAWDEGITWRSRRTVDPTDLPVTTDWIRDRILRAVNGSAEDDEIESWTWGGVQDCEAYAPMGRPARAIMPQTWELILSAFPLSQRIVLPRAPVLSVSAVSYYDTNGDLQDLAATSPESYNLIPSGAYAAAEVQPLPAACFPTTQCREDAVTITFLAGYEDLSAPAVRYVINGIGLYVGEMYRQRTLSIVGTTLVPSVLKLERFWSGPF